MLFYQTINHFLTRDQNVLDIGGKGGSPELLRNHWDASLMWPQDYTPLGRDGMFHPEVLVSSPHLTNRQIQKNPTANPTENPTENPKSRCCHHSASVW